jgi:hypothetical protein
MAAGPLSKLIAGKYLQKAAKEAGWGTAMNAGIGLMVGGPEAALAYGLGDLAVNVPAIALAKGLAPNKQWVHNVANVGASLASMPLQDALYRTIGPKNLYPPIASTQLQSGGGRQAATVAQNNLQNPQLAGQRILQTVGDLIDSPAAALRELSPETLRGLGYAI